MPTHIDHSSADPAWVPATFIAACKQSCRIDPNVADEDLPVSFANTLVPQAVGMVEDLQWRILQPKSLTASIDRDLLPLCLKEDRLWLPYGRLSAASLVVTITDTDGDAVVVPAEDLVVHALTDPAWLRYDAETYQSWSDLFDVYDISETHPTPVTIEWTAGYTSFDALPSSTKLAIELAVKHLYFNPESVGDTPASVLHWAKMNALLNREPHRLLV